MTYQCKIKTIFSILLSLFVVNPANALDVQKYEELKNTSLESLEIVKIYINGVGNAYSWSNSILKQRGDRVFYCPPSKIAFNADNYLNIADSKIASLKKSGKVEIPVELILYLGLVESFPCSKEK